MLQLRIILVLALGFSFNSATAHHHLANTGDMNHFNATHSGVCTLTSASQSECFVSAKHRRRGQCSINGVWALNVSQPCEDFCYLSPKDVVLWLPKGESAGWLSIENTATQELTRFKWPANKNQLRWPHKRMPLTAGEYLITIGGNQNRIVVHKIPVRAPNIVNWMKNNGCKQQAKMLDAI